MLSPAERKLRARIAANVRASKYDSKAVTAAANAATWKRYLDQVDPERALEESERVRRANAAFRADQARKSYLALKARQARRVAAKEGTN